MKTRAPGSGGLHSSMLEHVGDASSFDGHHHKKNSTKNPLGRCLASVLEEEDVDLLKVYLKKPLSKTSKGTEPTAHHLRKYNENTRAIVATLVGVARGDLLRTLMELPADTIKPRQLAALTASAASLWMQAAKMCFEYTAGKPREFKEAPPETPMAEIIILNPNVPEVALPLPELEK